MKKLLLLLLINIFTYSLYPQYKVEGGVGKPFEYSENLSGSGVEKIYLLNTLSDATVSYKSSAVSVNFYRYKESLDNKELIPDSEVFYDGTTYIVSKLRDGYGYLVEENGSSKAAIWIIDYSLHLPQLTSIEAIEDEDKCEYLKLYVTKSDELSFFTNGGAKKQIPRKYTISYKNKEWSEETRTFDLKDVVLPEREIGTEVLIDAPLMDTEFTLQGDQFAKHFGLLQEVSSVIYSSVAVEAHMYAEQERREAGNELGNESGELGGSAPATINFYGYGNEPQVGYYTWFIYNRNDLENPIARYTEQDISYTFKEWGDYRVSLEVAEQSSICVDSVSVDFSISESWI